jgi:hypothetical protein
MMLQYGYIYWRDDAKDDDGNTFAVVDLLVDEPGTNRQYTLSRYLDMVNELRKTFPQAMDDKIEVGRVMLMSTFFEGFAIISWCGYLPKKEYAGYDTSGDRTQYSMSAYRAQLTRLLR